MILYYIIIIILLLPNTKGAPDHGHQTMGTISLKFSIIFWHYGFIQFIAQDLALGQSAEFDLPWHKLPMEPI